MRFKNYTFNLYSKKLENSENSEFKNVENSDIGENLDIVENSKLRKIKI